MRNTGVADMLRGCLGNLQQREKSGDGLQGIESICLTILALRHDRSASALDSALRALEMSQNTDGSWPAFVGDEPQGCWATGLATLALLATGRGLERIQSAIRWLIRSEGREANWFWRWKFQTVDASVKFDPTKYGWSWVPGTTSWVIPTAFSLITLRQIRDANLSQTPALTQRIDLGISMLLDRICPGGGWNSGNGTAFGIAYAPYVDTTSIALLALRGYTHEPAVQASLSWLTARLADCPSPYSLAWGILALAAYRNIDSAANKLLARAAEGLIVAMGRGAAARDAATFATCALAFEAVEGVNVFEVRA